MTKTPITLQELRQRIYQKAKAEPTHRFWGLFTHITSITTLHEAYQHAKKNGGAAGIDGKSFADVEQEGVIPFLNSIQEELRMGTYKRIANDTAPVLYPTNQI
jgi:RNA-directed DNA polymerase